MTFACWLPDAIDASILNPDRQRGTKLGIAALFVPATIWRMSEPAARKRQRNPILVKQLLPWKTAEKVTGEVSDCGTPREKSPCRGADELSTPRTPLADMTTVVPKPCFYHRCRSASFFVSSRAEASVGAKTLPTRPLGRSKPPLKG